MVTDPMDHKPLERFQEPTSKPEVPRFRPEPRQQIDWWEEGCPSRNAQCGPHPLHEQTSWQKPAIHSPGLL